mmetsp:Transcript_109776/g.354170  ORF Transcript_109776/g.354170 Transcript_109776/m.354170 type:complete len:790 (+) Transcript_109776:306-2675(+)
MPLGDATEVAQGGATLSGGQRARIGVARASYRAALNMLDNPGCAPPLVMLDDPFCALDRRVGKDIVTALFAQPSGLLCTCAVVVAAADVWWLRCLRASGNFARIAVLRDGGVVALGGLAELAELELPELSSFAATQLEGPESDDDGGENASPGQSSAMPATFSNPQDEQEENENENRNDPSAASVLSKKIAEACTQTPLTEKQKQVAGKLVLQETRQEGHVQFSTYMTYLMAVGPAMLTVMCASLASIMVFQNLCTLWIAYWTAEDKSTSFMHGWFHRLSTATQDPSPHEMLVIYACFVAGFTASNFLGHALEILGGMRAARTLFSEALLGTLTRPFRWWDSNPTGRVLNRFSEDVDVMDKAVTNIIGVMFGALLYFVGHSLVLAVANPVTLGLMPLVALGMEFYARYYRSTIRELQRVYLVSVSSVYQDMVEAICGKMTIRAFASSRLVLCSTMCALDGLQRASFAKQCVGLWIGLRMALVGYTLNTYTRLQPVLQYFGFLSPQSAALVGFSIEYSQGIVGIIQQLIMNYSDLEMQLVSIERLREYGAGGQEQSEASCLGSFTPNERGGGGLILSEVEVTYRAGLRPALTSVNLSFAECEAAAIVGRTGAGKTSLLLSVLQLVPYTGSIMVGGWKLSALSPTDVRTHLVAVVPQQPVLFLGNLRHNLDPEGRHSDTELRDALAAVGLRSLCGALAPTEGRLVLSQGQQQMLSAARALLRRPRVVLLDEVTACLPSEAAKGALQTLLGRFKDVRATVLVVTHQEHLLQCCDRIIRVAGGRVVSDERVVA